MKKIITFFLLSISASIFSQTLYSGLDKKALSLGEIDVYKIRIENLGGKDVFMAPKNQLLPFHFEAIKDSVSKKQDVYERIVEFAVYQEGKFTIPALDIKIGDEIYHTVPYEVEVVNSAKNGDQIGDIMKNKEVKLGLVDYWELYKWYLFILLGIIALAILIFGFLKYFRKRKSSPAVLTNQTLKDLDALRKKSHIENGDFRAFYVELIDISRGFLTKQYRIPADVLLTDDLIDFMKKNHSISLENEKVVEAVFVRGDLVKFAKTFPDQTTMQKDFDEIRAFVKCSSKDLEFENLRKDV